MSDADFLAAIAAAPGDPAPRLAYSDWLDERGDGRAAYLRLHRALGETLDALQAARDGVDPEWLAATEARRDVVVHEVRPGFALGAVKVIRGLMGRGVKEAVDIIHSLPRVVLRNVPAIDAERARAELAPFARVTLEPATAGTG